MNASTSTATFEFVAPPYSEALRVVVLYENFLTGLRAKSILDRLMNRLDPAAECRSDWIRLDLLRQPLLAVETMKKVVTADIVMVSAHGTDQEPKDLETWLEIWLRRRGNRSGALVVSFDADAEQSPVCQRTLLHFRVIAAKCGMMLFPQFGGLPGSRAAAPDPAARERTCAVELRIEKTPKPD